MANANRTQRRFPSTMDVIDFMFYSPFSRHPLDYWSSLFARLGGPLRGAIQKRDTIICSTILARSVYYGIEVKI